mgnify:CR=1 FL=1
MSNPPEQLQQQQHAEKSQKEIEETTGVKFFQVYHSYRFQETYSFRRRKQYLPLKRKWQFTDYGLKLHEQLNNAYNSGNEIEKTNTLKSDEYKLPNGFRFKLASYNLLAPDLLDNNYELYLNINKTYLNWNYRKNKIFEELKYFNSDVIQVLD